MVHFNIDKPPKLRKKKYVKDEKKSNFCYRKMVDFCKRTDLHGYKYIVMDNFNTIERGFWVLAVLLSIMLSASLVVTAYQWYARNPIVTVIESTQGAVWDIPFPAVTICDLNVISKSAAVVLVNNLTLPQNVTKVDVLEMLRLSPLLHSMYAVSAEHKQTLRKFQNVLDTNQLSIENMFKKLSPAYTCGQLIERCMWKNSIYRCDAVFKPLFTHFSRCCTFNYYAVDLPDESVSESSLYPLQRPRRVASCGYQTALTVLVSPQLHDYFSASTASQGVLVLIDNAYNVPNVDSPVRLVNPATEVLIALSPESTYTTAGVKTFKVEDRQCFFNNEVKLDNFRQYSFHNCIAYQRVEAIRNMCECVPFYFPLKDYHRTCNFNDLECLETVLLRKDLNEKNSKMERPFKCLPECEHFDYPLEVAFGKLSRNAKGSPLFNDVKLENHSVVNIFFNDLVSTRYRRDVYLNWQNLLASFGGLLSLMLGFTLISGIDLIIFFIFGIVCGSITTIGEAGTSHNTKEIKLNKVYVQQYKKGNSLNKHSNTRSEEENVKWKTYLGNRY